MYNNSMAKDTVTQTHVVIKVDKDIFKECDKEEEAEECKRRIRELLVQHHLTAVCKSNYIVRLVGCVLPFKPSTVDLYEEQYAMHDVSARKLYDFLFICLFMFIKNKNKNCTSCPFAHLSSLSQSKKNMIRSLVMERMDGDLGMLCRRDEKSQKLWKLLEMIGTKIHGNNVDVRLLVCFKICMGLFEMHDVGIVHRDLKPDNVMVRFEDEDQEGNDGVDLCRLPFTVKIGDLGTARSGVTSVQPRRSENNAGSLYMVTRWYRPPEILMRCLADDDDDDDDDDDQENDDQKKENGKSARLKTFCFNDKCDIWSLGFVFFSLHFFIYKRYE
jgi:serine/threonine protein kinase